MTAASPETLARVAARIREELDRLREISEAMDNALQQWGPEPQSIVHVHWVGGLVHDFYTGLERVVTLPAYERASLPPLPGRLPDTA
jgi:hypothetical protein